MTVTLQRKSLEKSWTRRIFAINYKDDTYIVYRHISPSGKNYIGITHQKLSLRWRSRGQGYRGSLVFYNAIQKYGWSNIRHEILFEGLSYEEACEKEQEMIKKYNSRVPNGYNVDEGGYAGTCFKKSVIGFD